MVQIAGKPFTQLTNLNITDELRVDGEVTRNITPSARTFYVQAEGDDTLAGNSFELANATIGQAIIGVNALVPPSSTTAPSAIVITGAGTFDENVIFPEGCQVSIPSAFIVATTGDSVVPGSGAEVDILAVANVSPSTSSFRINNKNNVGISCSSITVVGATANGVFIDGTSDDVFVNVNQISITGINSVGIRDETSVVGAPEFFRLDQVTLEANGTTGILYNPALADTDSILRAGLIGEINGVTGTTGLDVIGGRLDASVNEIIADTAIHVGNGAVLDLIGNVVDGDIIVDVGGTLNCRVITHSSGTVTNNGTINGFIANDHFGNLVFLNDITIAQNLLVQGTTTFQNVTNISVADRYINLNAGYETQAPVTSGISANYLPLSANDTVTAGQFTAGIASTSNPTVVTVGSATLTTGQIIQITGTDIGENDGIYEVETHIGTLLTIRGVGIVPDVEDFTRNQFIANASDNATIRNVTVSIIRTSTTGNPEHGSGATTPLTFRGLAAVAGANTQLQFNNSGVFGADANLVWNGNALDVGGEIDVKPQAADGVATIEIEDFLGVTGYLMAVTDDSAPGDPAVLEFLPFGKGLRMNLNDEINITNLFDNYDHKFLGSSPHFFSLSHTETDQDFGYRIFGLNDGAAVDSERLEMIWDNSVNAYVIQTGSAGTGIDRPIRFGTIVGVEESLIQRAANSSAATQTTAVLGFRKYYAYTGGVATVNWTISSTDIAKAQVSRVWEVVFKDKAGVASVPNPFNIIVESGFIDFAGNDTISITTAGGSISMFCDGTNFYTTS